MYCWASICPQPSNGLCKILTSGCLLLSPYFVVSSGCNVSDFSRSLHNVFEFIQFQIWSEIDNCRKRSRTQQRWRKDSPSQLSKDTYTPSLWLLLLGCPKIREPYVQTLWFLSDFKPSIPGCQSSSDSSFKGEGFSRVLTSTKGVV